MRLFSLISAIFLLSAAFSAGFASPPRVLQGRVLDSVTHGPLSGAVLIPLTADGKPSGLPLARTGASGYFHVTLRDRIKIKKSSGGFLAPEKITRTVIDPVTLLRVQRRGYQTAEIHAISFKSDQAVIFLEPIDLPEDELPKKPKTGLARFYETSMANALKRFHADKQTYLQPPRKDTKSFQWDVHYDTGLIKTVFMDSNHDGKADIIFHFNIRARLSRIEMDTDHDGKIDKVLNNRRRFPQMMDKIHGKKFYLSAIERSYRRYLKYNEAQKNTNIVWCGPKNERKIALTFDDAPDRTHTEKILKVLRRHKVIATFFLVGDFVRFYPEIVKKIHADGHSLGNHSYSHTIFTYLPAWRILWELKETEKMIKQAVGHETVFFRPPFGYMDTNSLKTAATEGYHTVMWDVDSYDWRLKSPGDLVWQVLKNVKPGSIILLHANKALTVRSLDRLIRMLRVFEPA